MQIFILFILLKIALTIAFVLGVSWLLAEYLPVLAEAASDAARGTYVEFLGEWTAKALNAIAQIAGKFFNLCIEWLKVIGIDLESLKTTLDEAAGEADSAELSF